MRRPSRLSAAYAPSCAPAAAAKRARLGLLHLAIAALVVLTAARPGGAATPSPCSADSFTIDGTQLTVAICPAAPARTDGVSLTETFSTKGKPPLLRTLSLDLLPDTDTARAIDDVDLQQVGIAKTLHLAVLYKSGAVKLEHALLVPGAIALK
jgi:hypothetical protein